MTMIMQAPQHYAVTWALHCSVGSCISRHERRQRAIEKIDGHDSGRVFAGFRQLRQKRLRLWKLHSFPEVLLKVLPALLQITAHA